MKLISTIAAATFALVPISGAHAASQVKSIQSITTPAQTTADQIIEQLHAALSAAKKPLPTWAADLGLRAYTAWKTYKNGARVEAVEKQLEATTIVVLQEVAGIKAIVDAGRDLTEAEYRRFRERLDGYGQRLDLHETMIRALQKQQDDFRRDLDRQRAEAAADLERIEIVKRKIEYRICGTGQVNDGQGNCVTWAGPRRRR